MKLRFFDEDDLMGYIQDFCAIPKYIHEIPWYLRPIFLLLVFLQGSLVLVTVVFLILNHMLLIFPIILGHCIYYIVRKNKMVDNQN